MIQYPGYNTEFYVVLEGVVTGPLVGLEELSNRHIEPNTPVWYEGLDDWKPAIMAPLTRQIFTPGSDFHKALSTPASEERQPQLQESSPAVTVEEPEVRAVEGPQSAVVAVKRPKAHLAWSIVVAVIFNLICGIIAIIYSTKVRTKYNSGNYAGAERCSESAQWWIAVGIVVGLFLTVARILTGTIF